MLRVGVAGALGRMGRVAVEVVRSAGDFSFVGGFARSEVPAEQIYDDLERFFAKTAPDAVVDFTTQPKTFEIAQRALAHGAIPVIGSSGWTQSERERLDRAANELGASAVLVPNFALGAVLMMRFAEQAARFFPTAEIVELHHDQKRDKPSGTALETARRVTTAGAFDGVPIHSVRLRGLVAHQEVLFGADGETLSVRHDSFSRESFKAGIALALRSLGTLGPGLTVGLDWALEPDAP